MLTPETNSLTFGPRALSLLTNGTIFSVCFKSCDAIRCFFLAAICSKQIDETRAMSKRLDARQNDQEKMRSAWLQKSGRREIGSHWLPIYHKSKLFNVGFNEHGETRDGEFEREQRVKF